MSEKRSWIIFGIIIIGLAVILAIYRIYEQRAKMQAKKQVTQLSISF